MYWIRKVWCNHCTALNLHVQKFGLKTEHECFFVSVQPAHYGQPYLACNRVSIRNTISTPPGSMLPSVARGSGEIDAPFVGRGSFVRCCSLVQNADACGRRCMKGGAATASGRQRREKGEDYYDVVSIQVGKQVQDAGSCRGTDARSIRSLVPDKAEDYGCLHGERNG